MNRRLAALSVVLLLALASCGGDSDDERTTPAGAASPGGTSSPSGAAGPTSTSGKRKSSSDSETSQREDQPIRPGRPARGERLEGIDRGIYQGARARCRTLPLDIAARVYRAKSERPEDVARAFAQRMYPPPQLRRSAYVGCLDGLERR